MNTTNDIFCTNDYSLSSRLLPPLTHWTLIRTQTQRCRLKQLKLALTTYNTSLQIQPLPLPPSYFTTNHPPSIHPSYISHRRWKKKKKSQTKKPTLLTVFPLLIYFSPQSFLFHLWFFPLFPFPSRDPFCCRVFLTLYFLYYVYTYVCLYMYVCLYRTRGSVGYRFPRLCSRFQFYQSNRI